jgi:hypothetical protein
MSVRQQIALIMIILVLSTLACISSTDASQVEDPNPVFKYQDDFSNPDSGWDRIRAEEGITDYENGVYMIQVNIPETDMWSNPNKAVLPDDVVIEVTASKTGGPDDNNYGLICRYQDEKNFYFLIISSDGYYGIGKVKEGNQTLVNRTEMPPSNEIKQGSNTNRIRADCEGNTLKLYVNGILLDTQEDVDFTTGSVGLLVGSFEEAGVEIRFDDFMVWEP